MNRDEELQAHRECFAHGTDCEAMARKWRWTPDVYVVHMPDPCEHEWVAATVTLEFQGGAKQDVSGYRCTKCPCQRAVYQPIFAWPQDWIYP